MAGVTARLKWRRNGWISRGRVSSGVSYVLRQVYCLMRTRWTSTRNSLP